MRKAEKRNGDRPDAARKSGGAGRAREGADSGRMAELSRLASDGPAVQRVVALKPAAGGGGSGGGERLPAAMREGLEARTGVSFADVSVHRNSAAPAQLGAAAFARGGAIHLAPGEDRHLGHEAWHVAQQRQGRVRPTTSVNGVAVNDDPALEREADAMSAQLMKPAPDRAASVAPAAAGGPAQMKMGMEIEIPHAIFTAEGETPKGDTQAANHPYFKVVTDYRQNYDARGEKAGLYANIEFVMKPFDQLRPKNDEEAAKELHRRVNAMTEFFVRVDKANGAPLAKAMPHAKDDGVTLEEWAKTASVGLNAGGVRHGKRPDNLFVHYTIGATLPEIANLAAGILSGGKDKDLPVSRSPDPNLRAHQSGEVAARVVKLLGGDLRDKGLKDEVPSLSGYISLAFMQIAAFHDHVADRDRGQIKNRTAALSRVALREVFERMLSPDMQTLLQKRFASIDQLIADPLDAWNDDHTREKIGDLPKVSLGELMKSAFGLAPAVDPQRVFGGMKVTGVDDEGGINLIPVELRTIGAHYVTWDELRANAMSLMLHFRRSQLDALSRK